MQLGDKLGEGGEAEVFALGDDTVVRRWRGDHPSIVGRIAFTEEVAAGAAHLDFAVPEILDHDIDDQGRPRFVERRLPGRSMTEALADVSGAQRRALLMSYLETVALLREISVQRPWFGEVLAADPIRTETWAEYLHASLDRQVAAADQGAYPEVDVGAVRDQLHEDIAAVAAPEPALLHFDYFPGNVMCNDTRITAVIDWSVLSIIGDPDLDVALAVEYFAVTPTAVEADSVFARDWLRQNGFAEAADFYRRWGAAWWLPGSYDENIRSFVTGVLAP